MVEKSKLQAGLNKQERLESTATRPSAGILKNSSKSLDSVSEFGETQIERTDSNLESSEKTQTPNEEQKKFKTLCDGVQNSMALFQISMAELLALKDELLKHSLPPSLLVKVTLVTAKLFRGASDLSVPINELVRLVKLYSAPWETKSAALKKLHEDYENKQRQLNVALKKLVLVGIQSERMAQERKVLNWERLFSRMMTSKAHGHRWKFLIESFKKKVKTGEVYEAGTSTDEDAEREKEKKARQLEYIRKKNMNKDTAAKRIMRESVTIKSARSSLSTPITSVGKEEIKDVSSEDEALSDLDNSLEDLEAEEIPSRQQSIEPALSPKQPLRGAVMSPSQFKPAVQESPRPRIRFMAASDDEENSEEETQPSVVQFMPSRQPINKPSRPQIQFADAKKPVVKKLINKSRGVRFFSPSDDEEEEEEEEFLPKPAEPEKPKVTTEDKECWTNEPDCDRSLHLRIFRPICTKAESPCCSVVFCGQALKTSTYPAPPEPLPESPPTPPVEPKAGNKTRDSKGKDDNIRVTSKTGIPKKTSKTGLTSPPPSLAKEQTPVMTPEDEPPQFEELVFKLPDDNGYSPGDTRTHLQQEQIKIALHPSPDVAMIAMAAIIYRDITVLDQFEGRWSHTEYAKSIQQFPLISAVSDREMPFGSNCGYIPVVCYMSKIERPKTIGKETETPSFEELVQAEIEKRRTAEEAEREAAMEGMPQPLYTEEDMKIVQDSHAEELQALQEEYEKRLNELAQGLDAYCGNEEGMREFVHAATSPMFMRSPSPFRSQSSDPVRTPKPPSEARSSPRRSRPKIPNLPAWGKDLPENFMVRLDMFNENSEKYHQELEEKTKRAIQQKYELQMAVQNRLNMPDEEENVEEDVCLPAVFMPTRTGLVFLSKAHSYFHPSGSSQGRLTQPPSVFKLPHLDSNQVSVLNLFDLGQRFLTSGTQGLAQDNPTKHPSGVPHVPQTAPPPPTAYDIRSPPPYPGRSSTR